jgi:hypothetical protein
MGTFPVVNFTIKYVFLINKLHGYGQRESKKSKGKDIFALPISRGAWLD